MFAREYSIAVVVAGLMLIGTYPARASEDKSDKALASVLSHMPKEIIACQPHDKAKEEADQALLERAIKQVNAHDMAGLDQLMPDIETALTRAPDKPSLPENCEGKLVIYGGGVVDMLMASAMIGQKESGIASVVQLAPLPYARLYFVAGWRSVEHQDADAAIAYFAKGLLNDPRDPVLASEYANILAISGHSDQALVFADKYIDENPDIDDKLMALMLRRRGYALGELGRFDEAIAAYKQSLKLEPGNGVARNEIDYNKQQKALHKH